MKKIFILFLSLVSIFAINLLVGNAELSFLQLAQNSPAAANSGLASSINWLLILVGLLLFAVLVLIFDISNLSTKITGKKVLNWNNINAWLCLAFLVFGLIGVTWEFFEHGKYVITESASVNGEAIQKMFNTTLFFTGIVFVITQILLFVFAFLYRGKKDRKAIYYAHNNKLEIVWTSIPFVVMSILVLMGYKTWKDIMYKNPNIKAEIIEVYAYQFGWNARYPGNDNKLGLASFNYISSTNPLGLPVEHEIDILKAELIADTASINLAINNLDITYKNLLAKSTGIGLTYTAANRKMLMDSIEQIESGEMLYEMNSAIFRKTKQLGRIAQTENSATEKAKIFNDATYDDIVATEIHLVEKKDVEFHFRARDVIHSAYLPHFKAQMNVVPGMPTKFRLNPIITTKKARENRKDPEFDYYLICNKVCGSGHYNMKIKVIVETQAEYDTWIKSQKPSFVKGGTPVIETPAPVSTDSTQTNVVAIN